MVVEGRVKIWSGRSTDRDPLLSLTLPNILLYCSDCLKCTRPYKEVVKMLNLPRYLPPPSLPPPPPNVLKQGSGAGGGTGVESVRVHQERGLMQNSFVLVDSYYVFGVLFVLPHSPFLSASVFLSLFLYFSLSHSVCLSVSTPVLSLCLCLCLSVCLPVCPPSLSPPPKKKHLYGHLLFSGVK